MGASGPRPGNREYIHSWASLRSLVLISRAIFGLHQVLAVQTKCFPRTQLSLNVCNAASLLHCAHL